MNHQISPWSFYNQKPLTNNPQKDSQIQMRPIPRFKSTILTNNTQLQETQLIKKACSSINTKLQMMLSLQIIHDALREEQSSQCGLPLIQRCLILKDNAFKEGGFQRVSQSKQTIKLQKIENDYRGRNVSKRRKENLSVVYYEPFDESQIVTRGIMQLLRIKQRQLKMLSKHKSKSKKE